MNKLKKYLLATGCLVILVGALTVIGPKYGSPAGSPDRVITLADSAAGGTFEFDAIDVRGFHFVSFHAVQPSGGSSLNFRFSTQPGKFSDAIPKTSLNSCTFNVNGTNCGTSTPWQTYRIPGPFLLVRVVASGPFTLEVFLSK